MNGKIKFICLFAGMPFIISFVVASIIVWINWKPVVKIEPCNIPWECLLINYKDLDYEQMFKEVTTVRIPKDPKPQIQKIPSNLFEKVQSIKGPVDWNAVFANCKNYDMEYILFTLCKNDAERQAFLDAANKDKGE